MESKNPYLSSLSRRRALLWLSLAPPLMLGLASDEHISQLRTSPTVAGRLRLAMLSYWHVHASDYARQALNHSSSTLVAIWDEEPDRGRRQARALGIPFFERLEDLLARSDIDGVIIDTPTTLHRKVMIAAAQAGKHIFTEKVLAPTLFESHEIVAAVSKANVALMVSLPRLYVGTTLAIKQILNQYLLGELTQVRIRLFHDGALKTLLHPQGWLPSSFFNPKLTAGGAMIDLGAHPMYLAREFLGLPHSISATYSYVTGRDVEDSAVAVLRYPQGIVSIVETGFVNQFAPFTIEAHGTEGSLLFGTPDEKILIRSSHIKNSAAPAWREWTTIPPNQPTPFEQWIIHIQQGTRPRENTLAAIDLSALMEAAHFSAQRDSSVRLDTLRG